MSSAANSSSRDTWDSGTARRRLHPGVEEQERGARLLSPAPTSVLAEAACSFWPRDRTSAAMAMPGTSRIMMTRPSPRIVVPA